MKFGWVAICSAMMAVSVSVYANGPASADPVESAHQAYALITRTIPPMQWDRLPGDGGYVTNIIGTSLLPAGKKCDLTMVMGSLSPSQASLQEFYLQVRPLAQRDIFVYKFDFFGGRLSKPFETTWSKEKDFLVQDFPRLRGEGVDMQTSTDILALLPTPNNQGLVASISVRTRFVPSSKASGAQITALRAAEQDRYNRDDVVCYFSN